jgi:hypothetical protein
MGQRPSVDRLSQFFTYDPNTGLVRWKLTDRRRKAVKGEVAGTIHYTGYLVLCLDNCQMQGHAVAWALYHGCWPNVMLDHKNQLRHDNRIDNLRQATRGQNLANRFNTRGRKLHKGITLTLKGQYHARIGVDGKRLHLGFFNTLAEAIEAYKIASIKHHGEFSIYS